VFFFVLPGCYSGTEVESADILVMNMVGQTIITKTWNEGKHSLDLGNEASGIYLVKVLQHNKQYTLKLVKQ
jgi:hypothetical protein